MIGYTLEELEGMSFYRLVHPEDLAVFSTCHKTCTYTETILLYLIILLQIIHTYTHNNSPISFTPIHWSTRRVRLRPRAAYDEMITYEITKT